MIEKNKELLQCNVIESSVLLESFLSSSENLWVNEISSCFNRQAYLRLDLQIEQYGDEVFGYNVLISKSIFKNEEKTYYIDFSIDMKTSLKGLDYSILTERYRIKIEENNSNIIEADWSNLDDPIIKKIYKILQSVKNVNIDEPSRNM